MDKGNCTVIMKTDELQEKAYTFFKENKISELPQDPTTSYQRIIKNTINQCTHTILKAKKPYLKQIEPTASKLNTLPKIHKENIPIRPLVNYTTAPAYKLAKHMNHVIRTNRTFQNHTAIKNSIELIQSIKEKHIPTTQS